MYFNTKGKKGGTKSLQNFLKYIENSKKVNVVDDATKELDNYTAAIKHNHKIGGKYMTVGDYMDKIVEEAVEEAVADKEAEIADKDRKIAEIEAELKAIKEELHEIKKCND